MARSRKFKPSPPKKPLLYGIRPAPRIPTFITLVSGIDSQSWSESPMWVPVISSNVLSILYENVGNNLYLTFTSGRTWKYQDVPRSVAELCFNCSSIGSFEHRVLRNYTSNEVSGDEPTGRNLSANPSTEQQKQQFDSWDWD